MNILQNTPINYDIIIFILDTDKYLSCFIIVKNDKF